VARYKEVELQFSVFGECIFLERAIQAVRQPHCHRVAYTAPLQLEEHDMKKFVVLTSDADSVVKLDPWKAAMLKKIAVHVPAEGSASSAEFA
jgi:hypothetical protein